jgi:hypothetical protein
MTEVPQLAHFLWYHKMPETKIPLKFKKKGTFFLSRLVGTHFVWNSYMAVYSSLCTLVIHLARCLYCAADQYRVSMYSLAKNRLASAEVEQEHTLCLEQLYAINTGQFCDSARKQLGPIRLM